MNTLLDFSNRTVLITGAASGFGKQLARDLYAQGANLVLGDINTEAVTQLANELDHTQQSVIAFSCDVSNEQDCQRLVSEAVKKFKSLDIAVNNAGVVQPMAPFHEQDSSEFDRQFAINIKGVFFGMKHQIIQMLEHKQGIILNTSSLAGINGAPKLAAYSAAKHAVVGLTKTAAIEYARHNIRINAICPFYSPTPLMSNNEDLDNAEMQAMLAKGSPMKRLATPQEVVNAMILACAPGNSYMTGQTIAIDGGVSAF